MWHKWLQAPPSRKPQYWWTQVQQEEPLMLPFAHLFPSPPPGRCRRRGPSQLLVRALGDVLKDRKGREEPLAVDLRLPGPSEKRLPPRLPTTAQRAFETPSAGCPADPGLAARTPGAGGDHCESAPQLDMAVNPLGAEEERPRGLARLATWLRRLWSRPEHLDLAELRG